MLQLIHQNDFLKKNFKLWGRQLLSGGVILLFTGGVAVFPSGGVFFQATVSPPETSLPESEPKNEMADASVVACCSNAPPGKLPSQSTEELVSASSETVAPDETSLRIISGDSVVKVRSNADGIIRLGLARGGLTLVEFPADEYAFSRLEGDPDLVTIDEQIKARRKPTDPLIFRPGKNLFVPQSKIKVPYGQVTVQMTSGAVFTFQIYPAKDLAHSATRIVVMYDVAAITTERRRLGLPVELGDRKFQSKAELAAQEQAAADAAAAEALAKKQPPTVTESSAAPPVAASVVVTPQMEAERLLAEALALSDFKWEAGKKPSHGVLLAVKPGVQLLDHGKLTAYIIAVRNTLNVPVRLVDAVPELVVETRESKKAAINREHLNLIAAAGNLAENRYLDAYQTAYFVLVAQSPVLGAKQTLSIQAANSAAADEPASLEINVFGR